MIKQNGKVSDMLNFYKDIDVFQLEEQYGTPLYIYNEEILRNRCRDLKNLVPYKNFSVNYSAKANSNLSFLKIVKEEGLNVDAMSPGEIFVEMEAGFKPEQIFYISNNVSKEEMQYAIDRGIMISIDSLSQLEQYGQINPNSKVAIRFNPGVGAGHSDKVITGGKKTKFGVNMEYIPEVKKILAKYNLTLEGINQHIGSLFMDGQPYIDSLHSIKTIVSAFDSINFVDLGGGFGVPYHKEDDESPIDLKDLSTKVNKFMEDLSNEVGRNLHFKIEPGRYISAECCVLLGKIHSTKYNGDNKYVGTDLGFNTLQRPVMYDSHHSVEVYTKNKEKRKIEPVNLVGNICESGDIMATNRNLPEMKVGDLVAVMDAGAYGYCMASNYNNRLRPAEVLITKDGNVKLIRERDTLQDLIKGM
ncbi:MAG: diaminopimelate decarboxylase [Lachnospirales bacterium]